LKTCPSIHVLIYFIFGSYIPHVSQAKVVITISLDTSDYFDKHLDWLVGIYSSNQIPSTFISLSVHFKKMRIAILSFHGFVIAASFKSGRSFHVSLKSAPLPSCRITRTHLNSQKTCCPQLEDVCETTGVTLTRFMIEVERVNPELQELAQLFSGIQTAAKAISNLVKRSQLPSSSTLGYQGEVNVQGEDQKVRLFLKK
jgi:hypothetical protein